MSKTNWPLAIAVAIMTGIVVFLYSINLAHSRDNGQWGNVDTELKKWYESLKQRDSAVSCCGEADSYFCDEKSQGDQVYCIINDDRDNEIRQRKPIPNGTMIEIPKDRINKDPNPTGRAIVFLSYSGYVWCFVGISGS